MPRGNDFEEETWARSIRTTDIAESRVFRMSFRMTYERCAPGLKHSNGRASEQYQHRQSVLTRSRPFCPQLYTDIRRDAERITTIRSPKLNTPNRSFRAACT